MISTDVICRSILLFFQLPEPAEPCRHVCPALRFGSTCPQNAAIYKYTKYQAEDCLSLNVFVPYEVKMYHGLSLLVYNRHFQTCHNSYHLQTMLVVY